MRQWIYQVNHEYFIVDASSLHDAMIAVAGEGGVVIGDYTQFAHLFGE